MSDAVLQHPVARHFRVILTVSRANSSAPTSSLAHVTLAARTLGSWVRIPLEAWMSELILRAG
jgi:hypothetical protein